MKSTVSAFLLTSLLVSCAGFPVTNSIATNPTSNPTDSPVASSNPPTSTSLPVSVTEPSATPDYLSIDMGRYYVYPGEYSFIPSFLYPYQTSEENTFMGNTDRTLSMGLAGGANISAVSDESLVKYFLDAIFEKNGSYSITSSKPIFIDDVEGTWFELVGKVLNEDFLGSAVAVRKGGKHFFFAFGIGKSAAGRNVWEDEGRQAFSTILDSIQFLSEEELKAAETCNISSDPTYGYSKDNPIRVGGDAFGGPSRERAYLNSLSGPNEAAIAYSRNGSLNYGNTILDEFSLSYSGIGQPVIVYIDEYSFSELFAPKDFGCFHQFPLNPP